MDGLELLEELAKVPSAPPAIFMTGYGSTETAVEAMRKGAIDYVAKPFTSHELLHVVERNLKSRLLEREVKELRRRLEKQETKEQSGMVADSVVMKRILATASQIAPSNVPVLIEGETGTGKELLARYIHQQSPRATRPFIAVNCGALHRELLLSELFGHKRGAFTGAVEDRVGRFELANGGTIFLDEIGELEPSAQTKLLRVLQEKTFERLGDAHTLQVDVRVLAATNRRLEAMVEEDAFRGDLYYRLAVITLRLPPLRERIEDIIPLAEAFLRQFADQTGRNGLRWTEDAKRALISAQWLGNIRELQNAVQRALLLTPPDKSDVTAEHLQPNSKNGADFLTQAVQHTWSLEELEREYLKILLARQDLKLSDVCRILQLDSTTLWRKRKKYGL
jgi:two-component system response regulator HydG